MRDIDERRILARAQSGDMYAFEELVNMHQQRVFNHCYRITNNAVESEDLTAEAFVRAWQHIKSLKAEPSIIHWLLRVANNLSISWLRKNAGERASIELDEIHELPSDKMTPEEEMMKTARMDIVKKCLNQLAPKEKIAVLMFYLEERSLDEVAAVLGCGIAGAKSRVHRARHKLRNLVEKELGEDLILSEPGKTKNENIKF